MRPRVLLGGGVTPWHALRDLAVKMYEERESEKGTSWPRPRTEIAIRVFENPIPQSTPRWVGEATWEPAPAPR